MGKYIFLVEQQVVGLFFTKKKKNVGGLYPSFCPLRTPNYSKNVNFFMLITITLCEFQLLVTIVDTEHAG